MDIIKFNNKEIKVEPRDSIDISVMREIFKLREYRAAEEAIREASDPIIDVGAHAGFFVLYCRVLNQRAQIFAIEPEPSNLTILEQHLKLNKIKKTTVVAGAIAGNSDDRYLTLSANNHNHKLSSTEAIGDVKVYAWSLRDFCREHKIEFISLLKLDVEGTEFEIFDNLTDADFGLFKNVILEYHNSSYNNHKDIEGKLRSHGFGVQIFPSKFDKNMGFIFASNKRI